MIREGLFAQRSRGAGRALSGLALLAVLARCALPATAAAVPAVDVAVEGVDEEIAAAAIREAGLRDLDCSAAAWALRFRAGRLEEALRSRLRDRARLAPTFEQERYRERDCWVLRLAVEPGPETVLRAVRTEIRGPGRDDLAPVLERRSPTPGSRLDEGSYEALKTALREQALALGYLSAEFREHRIDAWPEEGLADLHLVFDTGPRHRFEAIDLRIEPDRLDPALIERVLGFEPDEPWSLEAVGALRSRLLASGYVESVDLRSRPGPDASVSVDARVRLQPRHRLSAGLGFATDIGPRAEIGYENRYLNRSGHQAGAELRASPVLSGLRGEYRLPLKGRRDPWLHLEAGATRERTDTVTADAVTASARRVHRGPLGTRMTEFLELSRERFRVAEDRGTARLALVGLAFDRTRRRERDPLELGWRLHTSVRGTARPVSSTSLLQLRAESELALAAGAAARIILRGSAGTTWTPSIRDLPSSLRFFAGGDRSIRGYGLDDVGPLAGNGEVRGGRHLLAGTVEYERMIRGRWSAALFADSGSAFDQGGPAPWVTGVGVGLRWHSPIGPLRLDLAVPLDDPTRQLRLHVGVGALFR